MVSAPIEIGVDPHGAPIRIDVEELLATRLLVQGNSGSGKSHLLRRLLEESAGIVQQVVIDPEGAKDKRILDAARACPVDAITLIDARGEQVWP